MELFIKETIDLFTTVLTVLFTAALPVIELRGAIPVGISLGLSPLHAVIISFVGSMIPVPFILLTIKPVFNYLKKTKLLNKYIHKLTERSLKKHGPKVQKYGMLGLILLVAIPIPGTGVWSGSLVAALLNMRFKWAFFAIFMGNLIAAILIVTLTNSIIGVFL